MGVATATTPPQIVALGQPTRWLIRRISRQAAAIVAPVVRTSSITMIVHREVAPNGPSRG